jgi:hypothetical protein
MEKKRLDSVRALDPAIVTEGHKKRLEVVAEAVGR